MMQLTERMTRHSICSGRIQLPSGPYSGPALIFTPSRCSLAATTNWMDSASLVASARRAGWPMDSVGISSRRVTSDIASTNAKDTSSVCPRSWLNSWNSLSRACWWAATVRAMSDTGSLFCDSVALLLMGACRFRIRDHCFGSMASRLARSIRVSRNHARSPNRPGPLIWGVCSLSATSS